MFERMRWFTTSSMSRKSGFMIKWKESMRTTTITRAGQTTSRSRWTLCERSDLDISSCTETIRLPSSMRRSSITASTKSPMLKRYGGRSIDSSSLEICTPLIYPTFRTDLSRSWFVVPVFRSPMRQTQSQEITWWITTTLKLSWNEPRTTSTYWRHVNSDNSFFHYCFLSRSSLLNERIDIPVDRGIKGHSL